MKVTSLFLRIILSLVVIVSMLPILAFTQSQEKMYATLIMNFTRGIVWPGVSADEEFTIGVFEYPPLATELTNAIQIIKTGSKKIKIKQVSSADDAVDCQILFIPAFKAKSIGAVLASIGSHPTLIITNKMDMAKKGSGVNFLLVDGKLKYEINCKAIEQRGMKISANIKGMGIVVE